MLANYSLVYRTLIDLNVQVILGERLNLTTIQNPAVDREGRKIVYTETGRELRSQMIVSAMRAQPLV